MLIKSNCTDVRVMGGSMSSSMTRRKALSAAAGIAGLYLTKNTFASGKQYDGITSATVESTPKAMSNDAASRVVLVLKSIHHGNTEKLAVTMAKALNAQIKSPQQISIEEFNNYDLIGFGSGIYDQKHHQSILDLVDKLPGDAKRRAFIYSTSGVSRKTCLKHSIDDPHTVLRQKLLARKVEILGEFNCVGWNTNSFLKFFGGINKGKPNDEDLRQAKEFAPNLKY